MAMMVDIHSTEFQTYIKRVVLETIKESLADMPPKTDIAMLLHLHIKDMQAFRNTVESQLSEINGRLDSMDGRLTNVENDIKLLKETMFTKADWERENQKNKADWERERLRLIEGIGVEMRKIFDEKHKS